MQFSLDFKTQNKHTVILHVIYVTSQTATLQLVQQLEAFSTLTT